MSLGRPWSPYVVGAAIGALDAFTLATSKQGIGVTTPFETTAALAGQKLAPRVTGVNRFVAEREEVPKIDGEWMLVVGLALGSQLASGAGKTRAVPRLWRERFGPSPTRRFLGAFLGGALMMFGARTAKGCTSGHAISGTMQLAGSSVLFSAVMSVAAAATAHALYGWSR